MSGVWMDTGWLQADVASEGSTVSGFEYPVEAGNVAIVFAGDENVVVEGKPYELRAIVHRLARLLEDDEASSVSRQHYIDTGRYLTVAEVQEIEEEQA